MMTIPCRSSCTRPSFLKEREHVIGGTQRSRLQNHVPRNIFACCASLALASSFTWFCKSFTRIKFPLGSTNSAALHNVGKGRGTEDERLSHSILYIFLITKLSMQLLGTYSCLLVVNESSKDFELTYDLMLSASSTKLNIIHQPISYYMKFYLL